MISTILFIGLIVGVSVLGIYGPIKFVDHRQSKTCPGCLDGSVLFTDRGQGLCHKHWERWDRINELERKLDFEMRLEVGQTEQDERADALDRLLERLDPERDYPVKMKIAGDWIQIGQIPSVLPKEPGAVSPQADGSR